MSKEEFLKIQTCDLKVNIHCDGCKQKVKKLLQKIDGVYTTSIDAEQGKVTVSGNVDPATLIKKLAKHGKHAQLWASKGAINPQFNLSNQFPKLHLDNGKVQKDNGKPQKGGGDGGKDQKIQQQHPPPQLQQQQAQQLNQQQQQLLQQMKGFNGINLPNLKDMKLPLPVMKDPKSVKFSLPPEDEGSDYDDFDDDDEYEDDDEFDLEGFEDFDDDLKQNKMKPPVSIPAAIPPKKGDVNNNNGGKKGDQVVQGQNKSDGKNSGQKNGGTVPIQDGKNGNKGPQNNNNNNNNSNGGAIGGKKGGGGKPEGHQPAMNQQPPNMMMMNNAFQGMNLGQMGQMGRMGQMGQMGQIHGGGSMAMPHMGNVGGNAAVQGLPAGGMPPEVIPMAHPYQQQYMTAMMQQRMMHGGEGGYDPRMYPQMGYGRPMAPGMAYFAPPPPTGGEYTHFFSDENTNSCSIM
ncbi:Copper chaperone domain-containing protein [Dioscorea alata]|uniref:Copper chaperone domain-containing protein n=1 Tax=Dioscorea alata TaxID=55571 RepID=A0ACB7VX04_DIOAL|nr:Copper chaperone domain-containing protein [Dioscorea alata]